MIIILFRHKFSWFRDFVFDSDNPRLVRQGEEDLLFLPSCELIQIAAETVLGKGIIDVILTLNIFSSFGL